jgi:hypothetical protein
MRPNQAFNSVLSTQRSKFLIANRFPLHFAYVFFGGKKKKKKEMNFLVNKTCFQPPKNRYDISLPHLKRINDVFVRQFTLPWNAPTLLVFHDLNEDVSFWQVNQYATTLGCNMIVVEYPGYGLAPGTPNEQECHALVLAVYELFKYVPNLVLLGNGFGCYFSCFLAHYLNKRHIFLPLILLNPYPSFFTCFPYLSWMTRWFDVLNSKVLAPQILSNTLILYGQKNKWQSEMQKLSESFTYLTSLHALNENEDIAHTTTALYLIRDFLVNYISLIR